MIIVVALVVVFYLTAKFSTIYKSRGDLQRRVEYQLDFVDNTSMESVKQDLVRDAARFGLALSTNDIHILYEDTTVQSVAQQIVGSRLGATFTNKRVAIDLNYTVSVLGIPFNQSITQSKIKQVAAPRTLPNKAAQEALDTP
jgi:F0F1-type ATP synthase membrane subunit a